MPNLTGPHWRKSSHSDHAGECVELADLGMSVTIRDSKDPEGPHLTCDRATFSAFVEKLRNGTCS
ncbi:DUF397 domain-containing protein [Spirillospora sp. NPDC047279]|uniref:DUF397 domain-containing protein n=1 Tax=Spirillospora sp. NPDC047279 TaxID=3155478 RepID=UPI0033EC0A52